MSPKPESSISPARRAAFDALVRVETKDAYASVLLASIEEGLLIGPDRALAQELVLGVLRWRRALDYLIELYAERRVGRLDAAVRTALRIGLYQIRFLTRIPVSAAVNDSVNLVKRARLASAAGMVNAVLRKAAVRVDDKIGAAIGDPAERAATELSHPTWLLERWTDWLGEGEARALALANNEAPKTAFRVNMLMTTVNAALDKLEGVGVAATESKTIPGAYYIESGPVAEIIRAAEQGLIYIQDPASQLVSLLLAPERGDRVLDLCAAPGSKSSHIAALTSGESWVVASDRRAHRLKTLMTVCRRLGAVSVDAVALDATADLPFDRSTRFDRVLVDAPCSGTGTLRRNPEIKWRLEPSDLPRLADLQLNLLNRAAGAVKKRGSVVYSTCSLEPEEGEGVVERFLDARPGFNVVRPELNSTLLTTGGYVRTFPHRQSIDGFFAAILEAPAK
jgi:16S rRNA (cytosine967-C5)-methyltransferase